MRRVRLGGPGTFAAAASSLFHVPKRDAAEKKDDVLKGRGRAPSPPSEGIEFEGDTVIMADTTHARRSEDSALKDDPLEGRGGPIDAAEKKDDVLRGRGRAPSPPSEGIVFEEDPVIMPANDTTHAQRNEGNEDSALKDDPLQGRGGAEGAVIDAVGTIKRVCASLDSGHLALADADTQLAAPAALLAAATFQHQHELEAVYDVARVLWNICVSRTNELLTDITSEPTCRLSEKKAAASQLMNLREHACQLLEASLRGEPLIQPRDANVALSFLSKTAILIHEDGDFARAETVFERAVCYMNILQSAIANEASMDDLDVNKTIAMMFDTQVSRASNAITLGEIEKGLLMLTTAASLAATNSADDKLRTALLCKLVRVRLHIGKLLLNHVNASGDLLGTARSAAAVLEGAYDILTTHPQLLPSWMSHDEATGDPDGMDLDHEVSDDYDSLHVDVLRFAACANVYAENYAAGIRGVELLRKGLEKEKCLMTPQLDFTLSYIMYLAKVSTDAVTEACDCLKMMIENPEAKFETCLTAMNSLVRRAPDTVCVDVAHQFLRIVSDSHPERTIARGGSIKMLETFLDASKNADTAVDAALILLSDGVVDKLLREDADKSKLQVYNLLFTHAAAAFQCERWIVADKLFQCSLDFQARAKSKSSPDESDPGRAKLLRCQARCKIESGLAFDALEVIETVEALEASSPSPSTLLVKLKALMHTNGHDSTLIHTLLNQLASFRDTDILIIAAQEAEAVSNHDIAARAFFQLLGHVTDRKDDSRKLENFEMLLFRLGLFHTMAANESTKHDGGEESHAVTVGKIFQKLLDFLKRNKSVPVTKEDGEYFSGVAWNVGLLAAKQNEFTPAAVCFSACARLISSFECPDDLKKDANDAFSYQVRKCMAMLLTGASLIEICKTQTRPGNATADATELNTQNLRVQAGGALAKHAQLVDALVSEANLNEDEKGLLLGLASRGLVLKHLLSAISGSGSEEQLKLMQSDGLTPSNIITMSDNSAKYGNPEAAARGYDHGLTKMLAVGQKADAGVIASVIRHRIEIEEKRTVVTTGAGTGAHERILELFDNAATHVSLLAGEYPADEAAWLVCTSYNRGVAHHRMRRYHEAMSMFQASSRLLPQACRADPTLSRMKGRVEEAVKTCANTGYIAVA